MKKIFIIFIMVLALFSGVYAESIDIVCPYCGNVGIEVLNDEDGICKCNSCDKMLLILNGIIYTDDGKEYQLKYRIADVSDNESESDDEDIVSGVNGNSNDGIDSVSIEDLTTQGAAVNSEKRDTMKYDSEPEYDIEKETANSRYSNIDESKYSESVIDEFKYSTNSKSDDIVDAVVATKGEIVMNGDNAEYFEVRTILSSVSEIGSNLEEKPFDLHKYILIVVVAGVFGIIGIYSFKMKKSNKNKE